MTNIAASIERVEDISRSDANKSLGYYMTLVTVKGAPHECVIRTGQSQT